MGTPPDTYSRIMHAIPDILRNLSQLYVSGRGSAAPSSSGTLANNTLIGLNLRGLDNSTSGFSRIPSIDNRDMKSVTGVRPALKPFVIGFIPPDILPTFVPVERNNATITTTGTSDTGSSGPIPSVEPVTLNLVPDTAGVKPAQGLSDPVYRKMADVAKNLGCSPMDVLYVLYSESRLNPGAVNYAKGADGKPDHDRPQALGMFQLTKGSAPYAGISKEQWKDFDKLPAETQLDHFQQFIKSTHSGPYNSIVQFKIANFAPSKARKAGDPNAVLYPKYRSNGKISNKWYQNSGLNPDGDITVGNVAAKVSKDLQSPEFLSQLARMKSVIGEELAIARPNGSTPSGDISVASSFIGVTDGGGSETAAAAIMATGNMNSPDPEDPLSITGRNISFSDKRSDVVDKQIKELWAQIDVANSTPSLLMLINPQEFTRNYEHQVDSPKGRRGPIVQMWLEKPLSISGKGVTAAQYAFGPTDPSSKIDYPSQGGGLTSLHRVHSLSYTNLMSLVLTYRNNGHLFTQAVTGDSQNWGIPVISMSIFIYYDGHIYIGSFDDFSVTDDAEKPFNLSYSWKFTARYEFDVTGIGDQINFLANGGPFDANAFPNALSEAVKVDQGSSVPSESSGPQSTNFPTIHLNRAPTGVT